MNEIMFYAGVLISVLFLLVSVYVFIKNKIVSVVQYLLKNKRKSNYNRYTNTETQLIEVAKNYATALMDADTTTLLPSLEEQGGTIWEMKKKIEERNI